MLEHAVTPTAENTRDLSRPDWQRGMGMVALSHLCDRLLAERATTPVACMLQDSANKQSDLRLRGKLQASMPPLWAQAYDLSKAYFQPPHDFDALTFPVAVEHATARHTFEKSVKSTFLEGLNAQRYFPLNIASVIENEAKAQSVEGYSLESLASMAQLFRKPHFHEVLTDCAFTINGIWKHMSSEPYPDTRSRYHIPRYHGERWFSFPDGNVTLDANLSRFLRTALTINNQDASPSIHDGMQKSLDRRPSSGCPVNHLAPHSSVAQKQEGELRALSRSLDVDSATLLRRRETTPIIAMTLGFADFLERVSNEYEQ